MRKQHHQRGDAAQSLDIFKPFFHRRKLAAPARMNKRLFAKPAGAALL